jgi:DNA-binding CsgD family transcriptional regulator
MAQPYDPLNSDLAEVSRRVAAGRLKQGAIHEQDANPIDIPPRFQSWGNYLGPMFQDIGHLATHPAELIPGPADLGVIDPAFLRNALKSGRTLQDIAKELNMSAPGVKYWADKYQIMPNKSGRKLTLSDADLFRRLDAGKSPQEIADEFKVTRGSIYNRIFLLGFTKMTPEDMRAWREFYKDK